LKEEERADLERVLAADDLLDAGHKRLGHAWSVS